MYCCGVVGEWRELKEKDFKFVLGQKKKDYAYDIFTINFKWWVGIGSHCWNKKVISMIRTNLNQPIICCKNIVDVDILDQKLT